MSPSLVLLLLAPAADPPKPPAATADEPVLKAYSPDAAAGYLDAVGVGWTRDRKCVTCHTNLPYLMARPLLQGNDTAFREVNDFFGKEAAGWAAGGKVRGPTYTVANAAGRAFADAHAGKLTPDTRAAFDAMWKHQKPTGEWDWLKCDWPPLEHDDYFGAVLAAVAVGTAPDGYANTDAAQPGLARLRGYLAKTRPPDLHHEVWLLWAATKLPGIMTFQVREKVVADLREKQRSDGGWSLPSLGKYDRRDGTRNDPAAPSDGYATGLAVYVLRQAGVPAADPGVTAGAAWLRANQRASGRWFTRSLNNDKAHYITNAGTAFAVMALAAAGDPPKDPR